MTASTPELKTTVRGPRRALRAGLCLLAHSALLWLALPPGNLWPLAFVSLVPVALAVRILEQAKKRQILASLLGLLPFWLATHLWTIPVTVAGYLPLCMLVTVLSGLAVWLGARASARLPRGLQPLVFALAWTGADFFRGEVTFDGYPWAYASHPLIEWWPAASPAAFGGVYLVTFLVALLGAGLVAAVHGARRSGLAAVIGALAVWGGCAAMIDREPERARTVRVAMLQTNLPQSNKIRWTTEMQLESWRDMRALALEAAETQPGFIVWPETMVPGFSISPGACETLDAHGVVFRTEDGREIPATFFAKDLVRLQEETGVPMLVGDEAVEGLTVSETPEGLDFANNGRFNSVFVVDRGKVGERYDKIHLTPFGEIMPYIHRVPWLQRMLLNIGATGMAFDLKSGRKNTVLEVRDANGTLPVRVVTPICFESTDASVVRKLVFSGSTRRADVIAFVTNDGWFTDFDAMRLQHLQAARWRCLELGTPGVRAANTGLSAQIDTLGRVESSGTDGAGAAGGDGRARVAGVLTAEVPVVEGATVYARVGDAWGWISLGALGVMGVVGCRRAKACGL